MMEFLKKNKKIIIPAGILLLLAIVFFAVRGRGNTQAEYQTSKVEKGELIATVGATGTVRARQSTVLAWQTSGSVEAVNAEVGNLVEADMVLAVLSSTSVAQNIILAEADLLSAQRALEDLKESDTARAQAFIAVRDAQDAYDKALNYYESLFEPYEYDKIVYRTIMTPFGVRRIPSLKTVKVDQADQETIDDAKASLDFKEAQLNDAQRAYERLKNGPNPADVGAAQARVDAAQATLNMARLIAPFNGTITDARPLVGDQVAPGTIGFRIDDLSSLLVDVDISEVDINSVAVGQPVTLTFDAILGSEYHGEVIQVAQAGDPLQGVVSFTVTVKLTDADAKVKPGMTAAVTIQVEKIQDVLLIPNRAVRLADGKKVIYVLRSGAPVQLEIELGASSDTMSVLLKGDVKAGDQVILNPPATFEGNGGPPFMRQ
jgi:HlyD family secretion protein